MGRRGDERGGSGPGVADLSAGATAPGLRWAWIGQYIGACIGLIAGSLLVCSSYAATTGASRHDGATAAAVEPLAGIRAA